MMTQYGFSQMASDSFLHCTKTRSFSYLFFRGEGADVIRFYLHMTDGSVM